LPENVLFMVGERLELALRRLEHNKSGENMHIPTPASVKKVVTCCR
jgi:hypothetical protein